MPAATFLSYASTAWLTKHMNSYSFSYVLDLLSFAAVSAAWVVFAVPLVQRSQLKTAGNRTRDPLSWVGLILQLAGYPISWIGWRSPLLSPVVENSAVNAVLRVSAIALAAFSAWFAVAAIRELGKQWSLQARVLEDHKLVTTGVYAWARHPIYTAMLGMLIATGLVLSSWLPLAVGFVVFFAGTMIRIRLEERLLADAFGDEFADWKEKVPALIPRPRP